VNALILHIVVYNKGIYIAYSGVLTSNWKPSTSASEPRNLEDTVLANICTFDPVMVRHQYSIVQIL